MDSCLLYVQTCLNRQQYRYILPYSLFHDFPAIGKHVEAVTRHTLHAKDGVENQNLDTAVVETDKFLNHL